MSLYCKIKKKIGTFMLDVEFAANSEIVAIMGASGCGKSMTLRCIAGIEKPDSGRIVIDGKTVYDSENKINLPPRKRGCGFLFQDFALFPNMTVKKNILVVMPKEKRGKIDEILERFHLYKLREQYPDQLSGGQKQRCAIARMMVSEPDIIMLDEPFSALDSYLRWQLETEIVAVIEKYSKTVLFVSHDRDEVYRISKRIVVMQHGKNEGICEKEKLYFHPKTYTDALLTGCKNISRVYRKNGFLHIPAYNLKLSDERKEQVTYIGIRAKKIEPAYRVESQEDYITAKYEVVSVTEAVFSVILMVRIEGASETLRWEVMKNIYTEMTDRPQTLAIHRSEFLMLE